MAGIEPGAHDDGVYVANLIDYGDLAFARAEVATLDEPSSTSSSSANRATSGEPGTPVAAATW